MGNDFGAVCFFLGKLEIFSFFTIERGVDVELIIEAGLDTLGVENPEAFETGDAALLVDVVMLFSFLD